MKYAKAYLDKLFDNISEYSSKVELLSMVIGEEKFDKDWVTEISLIMNWQAMSDRSGVWTFYEILNEFDAELLIQILKTKNEHEILEKFSMGIGKCEDERVMAEIDNWIKSNEVRIDKYIEKSFNDHRNLFYSIE